MASLTDILPILMPYKSIIVTGPQRSGTTIAAHIISSCLSYRYVDEDDIQIDNVAMARAILASDSVVLQAPGLCYCAESFGVPVVMMRRDLDDINKSQARIGWVIDGFEKYELSKYGLNTEDVPVAVVKYREWDNRQHELCVLPLDLDYTSLACHPLWIPENRRRSFTPRQWK